MSSFTKKLKENPKWFYALSVCATWTGAGSYIVGISMVKDYGVIPFLLWALGNALSCVFFGFMATRFKLLKNIFTGKIFKVILGIMCIFQLWLNMSAINDSLKTINSLFAIIMVYVICGLFLIYYLKRGMIRNVLTDNFGWILVYAFILIIAITSIISNGVEVPSLGFETEGMKLGLKRFFTLMIGPFFYPYFWEIIEYNSKNTDDVKKVDVKKSFALGALLFAIYILFVFAVAMTVLNPSMVIIKSILISIIAISTLTSFIYSTMSMFGNKLGSAINIFAFIGWKFLIPIGVMGIWNFMQDARFVIMIIGLIGYAIYTKFITREKLC